ncbi:MAG: helix-turn-helix domain-containing protein [Erythrobacter sp.]
MGGTQSIDCNSDSDASVVKRTIRSEFIIPPSEFDGCFTSFYLFDLKVEDGGRIEDYLQPEWSGLRFFAGETPISTLGDHSVSGARFVATGPSSLPSNFQVGTARMWGIGLLPLGWSRFMDVDAADLANIGGDGEKLPAFQKFAGLCDVLCDASYSEDDQIAAMIDGMRKLMKPNRDESKIMRVHKALMDVKLTSVAEFAGEVAMSVRTLERVCSRYFGFPPKLLMRRQRFMRSLTTFLLHQGSNWTEAMDEHYHDQAHFTREFREFMTMNPTEYAALDHPVLAAFMAARARDFGSPAQTLDMPER